MRPEWWLLVLGLALVLCGGALADGKMVPLVGVSQPAMPQQRAIIVYRDGVEKMVVESSFRGEGREVAWLLPVPAAPTEIAKASAALFTTLEVGLQPKVITASIGIFAAGIILLLWSLPLVIFRRFWVCTAGFGVVFAFTVFFLLPAFARARGSGTEVTSVGGVSASEIARIGSYDVQTLEADSADKLNAWLGEKGYQQFSGAGEQIVADYIKQGWKFVAARLHNDEGKLSRPHPLLVSFPAKAPVYPMRLTQLAGSDLRLDLFVVADRQVRADGMKTIYADRFHRRTMESQSHGFQQDELPPIASLLSGGAFYAKLALPSFVSLVGAGDCSITWLQADLLNAQLDRDFSLTEVADAPYRKTVWLSSDVVYIANSYMVLVLGAVIFFGAVISRIPGMPRGWIQAASLVLALVLGAGLRFGLPAVVPTMDRLVGSKANLEEDIFNWMEREHESLLKRNRDEVDAAFRQEFHASSNPLTNMPLEFEEAPGDCMVMSDERGVFVRMFGFRSDMPVGMPEDHPVARASN